MSIKALKANIFISIAVALTGILVPMALSFILTELVSATYLQAFAAGAALSATSLGTTFTILSTTGLISTRLGTVTTSAAMLDDVVGLVMVQVITNLSGGSDTSFDPITVIRPVFVSIGFAVGIFLLCSFCLKPALRAVLTTRDKLPNFMQTKQFAFLAHTALLFGMVAGATYAGTSSLFAAYLSGVIVTWFDELAEESRVKKKQQDTGAELGPLQSTTSQGPARSADENTSSEAQSSSDEPPSSELPSNQENYSDSDIPKGNEVYEIYYKEPVNRILIPLFFVSLMSRPTPPFDHEHLLNFLLGIYWFCDSYHRDVQRKHSMARYCVCSLDGFGKDGHWDLACAFLAQPYCWIDDCPWESLLLCYFHVYWSTREKKHSTVQKEE